MVAVMLNTEFTGLHKNTELISIGLYSEDGKTFYAEINDFEGIAYESDHDWIEKNVVNNLKYLDIATASLASENNATELKNTQIVVKYALEDWIKQFDNIEIWGDRVSYDWVLFCDLFEHALNIPKNIQNIPFDISTLFKSKNIDPDINRITFLNAHGISVDYKTHNALDGAKVTLECYKVLSKMK